MKTREREFAVLRGATVRAIALSGALLSCNEDAWRGWEDAAQRRILERAFSDLTTVAISHDYPGRGLTDYPIDTAEDIPKAYAMAAKAAARFADPGTDLSEIGAVAFVWLVDHADEDGDGTLGWGLPFAWDAFGDGTENPPDTEYAISTAIAVDAVLDWADEMGSDPARSGLLEMCWEALHPYLALRSSGPLALPPYSLSPLDEGWDVFNTAAYLAAVAQRLSASLDSPARSEALRDFADRIMLEIAANRRISPTGGWYWPYLLPGDYPNDLPHAAYIVYSIETYSFHGGTHSPLFDRRAIWRHLEEFIAPSSDYMRSEPRFAQSPSPARLYDIGFALGLICEKDAAPKRLRRQLITAIEQYRVDDGHYAKFPVRGPAGAAGPPQVINEYEVYLLWGVSTCLAFPRGPLGPGS